MAYIQGVYSESPDTSLSKEDLQRIFDHEICSHYSETQKRKIKHVINNMEIDQRPCYVDFRQFWEDLDADKDVSEVVFPSRENLFRGAKNFFDPVIGDRVIVWEEAIKDMAVKAARGVMTKTNIRPDEIDCVITNTSTGLMLPNLSTWLPQTLGLSRLKCHYSVDSTGCGGAIACLDLARSIILAGRASTVLLVTADCSSPFLCIHNHLQLDEIIPNLLFGDGCGSAIVTNKDTVGSWKLNEPFSYLLGEETSKFITLGIRNTGYGMSLSKDLIPVLYNTLQKFWPDVLKKLTKTSDVDELEWLVHPGGKGIVDIFTRLDPPLTKHHLRHSLKIMRDKGNLVSSTLISVLEAMMNEGDQKDFACLLGPGPGVDLKLLPLSRVY